MNMWFYVLAMGAATVSLRVLPVIFIRKPIESPYLKSFLFYVPYVTLAVMTVPAIFQSTEVTFGRRSRACPWHLRILAGKEPFRCRRCLLPVRACPRALPCVDGEIGSFADI